MKTPRLRQQWLAVLVVLAALGAAPAALAGEESAWRAAADKVFETVARSADLLNALIPVTMAQDADGFIWLGGDGGLRRWDGYQFRAYKAKPPLPNGLSDADVWTLHVGTGGQLWAGTTSGGLARYDPTKENLVCVPLAKATCGIQHVWKIADDGAGGVWVATSAGLFRLDVNQKVIFEQHYLAGTGEGPEDDSVLTVLRDHGGAVWIGTPAGLKRSPDGRANFEQVPLQREQGGAVSQVSQLMEDKAGRIWIGTRQEGAFVISPDRAHLRPIKETVPHDPGEVAPEIMSLLEVSPGRVWIGTSGSGIVEVDSVTGRQQRIVHDAFVPNSLDNNLVEYLFRDRSGLVWVATEGGLSRYEPSASGIMTFFGAAGRKDGLSGDSIEAIYAAPDGSLWAGLQGEGYVVLDPAGRRAGGLAGHRVFALAPAPEGGVLLGTDGGLYLADDAGKNCRQLTVPGLSPTVDVRTLRTINGIVWLAVRDGGLWQLRVAADGKITIVRSVAVSKLTNPVVDMIAPAPDGQVALGTDGGLNLINPITGEIKPIKADPADPVDPSALTSLNAGIVNTVTIDRRGRLWVGTSTGLDILEKWVDGEPRFLRLGVRDHLPNASIDGLLLDGQGKMWASTDSGLAVIDPDTLEVHTVQRADGLAITNYYNDSAAVMATGELVFGGIGGLTMVSPSKVKVWDYKAPVAITAARIGAESVPILPGGGGTLVVPANKNSLAVEFAALDYSAPMLNHYSYMLDGFDHDWVDTDAEHRVAAYTNLPPGNYRLKLRGSNRNGVWTYPATTVGLQVQPAWYQMLWFRLAAAAVALLAMAAVVRASTGLLRRRQRELERQVADRTAELSVSQVQLRAANAGLEKRVAERTQALAERTHALEASEARFRAWFNNAEDAVFVVQIAPDGRFLYEAVNAAVERIFGLPASDYPGHEVGEVLPSEVAEDIQARYREAAKGEPIQFETRIILGGAERLLDTWIVPVRNPVTWRVDRLVGASRDMTERRALEARLAQAQKLQALGGLAGGIAHDFNNILQAVAGAALLIEQAEGEQQKIQRLARSTIAAAERGTSITKRLLAFARSDELRVEAMPTAEVLEGLREVLSYTLGSAITVRTAFAPTLPPLLADRGQLETALVNLGTNARDAMPDGGVLTLSAEPVAVIENSPHPAGLAPGRYVRIDVADTGMGMDAITLARAVEPFFTTKPQGQGTGLGLALVKGFAEQSGGGMAIDSVRGVGTTVSLWLRQAAANAVYGPAKTANVRRPGSASARIFVVDDDDLVRETVAALLEGAGFRVETAACGADGVALIQSGGAPDALVCDLSMPGMNGIETIKQARELMPGLPCFLLTGYAGERAALGTGDAFTLLRKPISASALIAQIEAGLAAGKR